jgi:Domain of unknown function (DUF4252)
MRFSRLASLLLFAVVTAAFSQSQQSPSPQQHEWVPQSIESLRQNASSKTEFSLDHSMLVFASKLDSNDEDLRRVIAGVSGFSVHNYRFSKPWMYQPDALTSVKDEYHAAGWKQLVGTHSRDGVAGETDLWIRFQNNAISDIAVLLARSNEVDFISVTGSISPLDLSHLAGHFGIPKIEGGVVIPNSEQRP